MGVCGLSELYGEWLVGFSGSVDELRANRDRGKLVMDVGKKRPKLKCKNWECGVIIPVFTGKSGKTLSGKALERTEALGMEVFRKVVPVPMRVPAESIVEMQRVPWFHNEMIQELKRDAPPKVKKQKGRY